MTATADTGPRHRGFPLVALVGIAVVAAMVLAIGFAVTDRDDRSAESTSDPAHSAMGDMPTDAPQPVDEIRDAITAGQVTVGVPGIVVNMPIIAWPGGTR